MARNMVLTSLHLRILKFPLITGITMNQPSKPSFWEVTLWEFKIAMENCTLLDDFPSFNPPLIGDVPWICKISRYYMDLQTREIQKIIQWDDPAAGCLLSVCLGTPDIQMSIYQCQCMSYVFMCVCRVNYDRLFEHCYMVM